MTPDLPPTPDTGVLDLPPEQLDGHTVDDLVDYLERGRTPVDPSIEQSPACRRALAALRRIEEISHLLAAEDAAGEQPADDAWTRMILGRIDVDARAGDDFPISAGDARSVVMTEGALRGLIRAVGDGVPGLLVGRIRFRGDLGAVEVGAVTIEMDTDVVHGYRIPETIPVLRAAVLDRVALHTRLREPVVDIAVRDLITTSENDER